GGTELLFNVDRGPGFGPRLDVGVDLVVMLDAARERREARIARPSRIAKSRAKRAPLVVRLDADRAPLVLAGALVHALWRKLVRPVAHAGGLRAVHDTREHERAQRADAALELRQIDVAAAAALRPFHQRLQHREAAVQPADIVHPRIGD